MATIGIAGYMGSGKSTVAAYLANQGATVIDADTVAKQVMNADKSLRQALTVAFGDEAVDGEKVDFAFLGRRVFGSRPDMDRLNRIVHPLLLEELGRRIRRGAEGVCVLDAALISFWKIESWFDALCWVDADAEIRFARLSRKLVLSAGELRRRMSFQEKQFSRPAGAPWIDVYNNGTVAALEELLGSPAFGPVHRLLDVDGGRAVK